MRIRTTINGKEIAGYWNGKTYKSKINPEKNIRVYIDNVEYDIPKDEFHYEIELSEKQKEKAKELKERFLKILQEDKWEISDKIINYFKKKNEKWYYQNEIYLTNLLSNVKLRPQIVEAVIDNDPLRPLKIKRLDTNKETLKEILQRILTYSLYHESIPAPHSKIKVYEDDKNYYARFSHYNAVFTLDKKTKEIQVHYDDDILQEKKPKPIALLEY